MTTRAPITCHVLDTTNGKPAAHIPVSLTLISPLGPSAPLLAHTDADGRVTAWTSAGGSPNLDELFATTSKPAGDSSPVEIVWALQFNVGDYFQGEGFWTEVEVRFKTAWSEGAGEEAARRHWHVPLLLSPWSYTTYRGS